MKRPLRRKKQVGLYLGPIKPSLFQVLYYDFLFKVLYYDFLERFFGVQDRVEGFPRYLPIRTLNPGFQYELPLAVPIYVVVKIRVPFWVP